MHRQLCLLAVLLSVAGCRMVRVDAECRLTPDASLWPRLDGPRYVITGPAEQVEATLVFEEVAALLERALAAQRPSLRRVPPDQAPDIYLTMSYMLSDLGTGLASYPIYGHRHGHWIGPGGMVHSWHDYGPVGVGYEPVHYGFGHRLFLSVWIPEESRPAGRRVLWEGTFSTVRRRPDLHEGMPYLVVAAAGCYGESTAGRETIRFKYDDDRVEAIRETH